jgi:predicted kinase
VLIVMSGLPGTGKTSVSRALARHLRAFHLRIDTIEFALASSESQSVGVAGYVVAYAVAADALRQGLPVIADCVNPLAITRNAWREIAKSAAADIIEVEIVCSALIEHRRRVETRVSDIPGLGLPSWQDVLNREYEPWDRQPIVLDTAHLPAEECALRLMEMLKKRTVGGQ